MGFREFINNLVHREERETSPDLTNVNLPIGISADRYQRFFSESTERVEQIRDSQEYVMSRRVRKQVDDLCDAISRIVAHCRTNPDGILYAQDLITALRLVPQMLGDYGKRHQLDPTTKSPEQAALLANIQDMVGATKQIEQAMAGGVTANLDAYNKTLAGILHRYRPVSADLNTLTQTEEAPL